MPADPAAMDVYSECLANAKLTALRALLEIVNTTDDAKEKRQAATAILRTPDPNPQPKEPLASARGESHHRAETSVPAPPNPYYTPPTSTPQPRPPTREPWSVEQALACAEKFLNDLEAEKSQPPHLPTSSTTPAATLAAAAGAAPPDPRTRSP